MSTTVKKQSVTVNYVARMEATSTISSTVELEPIEVAVKAYWSFIDGLYPGDNSVPESIRVDDQVFSVEEVKAYILVSANLNC